MLLIQISPSYSSNMVGHTAPGTQLTVIWSLCLPCMVGRGLLQVLFHLMSKSESMVCIKRGDSGVVIGYQVDIFTCTLFAENFIAQLHIYPGLTGKVSPWIDFPPELGCEEYSFLGPDSWRFHGWSCFYPTISVDTPYLDASFEEAYVLPSSVSTGFLTWLVPVLIILDHSLLLEINCINYGARLGIYFYLYHRQVKCQPLKLIHYFPSHQQAIGLCTSSAPDNITLNPANKRTDWSLLTFRLPLLQLLRPLWTQE